MPELPEVEVLARRLSALVVGRSVYSVSVHLPRVIRPHEPGDIAESLKGRRIESVGRRAKWLVFRFSGSTGTVVAFGHLGMTGRMFLQPAGAPLPKHAVITIDLGEDRWIFEDTRRFGRFTLGSARLEGLGPEPLEPEFTPDGLWVAAKGSGRPLKALLLDQAVVAGVGNIYACEALHQAGLSPHMASRLLSREGAERLHGAIRATLARAIETGMAASLNPSGGSDGLFYYGSADGNVVGERFQVYDRAGMACMRCGGPIIRTVIQGRGTFHCPSCQAGH
jgi:formamidopyrimidine-DNA glycosylase